MTGEQMPLFEVGAASPKPAWSYLRGERRNCDRCRALLHRLGVARAPFPGRAMWIRTVGGVDEYLCRGCAAQARSAPDGEG
jgi:hypothetical protein